MEPLGRIPVGATMMSSRLAKCPRRSVKGMVSPSPRVKQPPQFEFYNHLTHIGSKHQLEISSPIPDVWKRVKRSQMPEEAYKHVHDLAMARDALSTEEIDYAFFTERATSPPAGAAERSPFAGFQLLPVPETPLFPSYDHAEAMALQAQYEELSAHFASTDIGGGAQPGEGVLTSPAAGELTGGGGETEVPKPQETPFVDQPGWTACPACVRDFLGGGINFYPPLPQQPQEVIPAGPPRCFTRTGLATFVRDPLDNGVNPDPRLPQQQPPETASAGLSRRAACANLAGCILDLVKDGALPKPLSQQQQQRLQEIARPDSPGQMRLDEGQQAGITVDKAVGGGGEIKAPMQQKAPDEDPFAQMRLGAKQQGYSYTKDLLSGDGPVKMEQMEAPHHSWEGVEVDVSLWGSFVGAPPEDKERWGKAEMYFGLPSGQPYAWDAGYPRACCLEEYTYERSKEAAGGVPVLPASGGRSWFNPADNPEAEAAGPISRPERDGTYHTSSAGLLEAVSPRGLCKRLVNGGQVKQVGAPGGRVVVQLGLMFFEFDWAMWHVIHAAFAWLGVSRAAALATVAANRGVRNFPRTLPGFDLFEFEVKVGNQGAALCFMASALCAVLRHREVQEVMAKVAKEVIYADLEVAGLVSGT